METNTSANVQVVNGIRVVNCTPHPIQIFDALTGEIVTFGKGEVIPRVSQTTVPVFQGVTEDGNTFNFTRNSYGEVENAPDPQPNTFYIVSAMVMNACPNRTDFVCPNQSVRDAEGRINGCQSFGVQ